MSRPWPVRSLLLATAAGFLLPIAALFIYQIRAASQDAEAGAQGDVLVLAQVTAAHYASFLADTERVLQALAQRPQVRAMDPGQCDPLLSQIHAVLPLFANVAVIARDFTIICSAARKSGGARASAAAIPGVAQNLDHKGLTVSEPFVGPITGRRVLSISYPVIGTDGGIVGRVGLPVDLEHWQALMGKPQLPDGTTLGVISRRGVLVSRYPELPQFLGQDISAHEGIRHMLEGDSGVTDGRGLDGARRVHGFTTVPGAGWRVYASRLESEVLAPAYAADWRSGAQLVGALSLLVLFFVFLSRWLAHLAAALARVSRALAGGEAVSIPETGPLELRRAIASVNAAVATRYETELALRQSERQHRALIDNLPGAVYRCRNDADYTPLYLSPMIEGLTGHPAEAILRGSVTLGGLMHPDDRERVWRDIHDDLARNGRYAVEYRIHRADGEERWIADYGSGIDGEDGAPEVVEGLVLDITARKRAEAAVRESERRLLELIDGLGPQIFVGLLAVDGTVLEVNRSALAAANVRREDVIGRPVHETPWVAHSPQVQKEYRDAVAAAAAGGTVRFDMQLAVAGAARAWIDFTLQPLRDSTGTIKFLVASGAVITERKQVEDELRRSAAQLDAAQERAHLGSWELDLETGQASWSREMFRLYRRDPARGVPPIAEFVEMIDPRDRALIEKLPKRVVAGGGTVSLEYRTNPAHGSVRHLNVVAYGTPEADGRVRRLTGTVLDITDRKHAEEAVRESERYYRELFEQATDGIFVADARGPLIDANAAGCAMLGGTREQVLAMTMQDMMAPSEHARIAGDVARLLEGHDVHSEWRLRNRDGTEFVADIVARCRPDGLLQGIVRDVSERNNARERLVQSLERAQSLNRRLVESQEAEQRRISIELHDRIGQNLTALVINVGLIGRALPAPLAARLAPRLRDTRALIEATVATMRGLMQDLRPAVLEDYGLLAGVRAAGRAFGARTHIAMRVHAAAEVVPRLPAAVELALYRIVQEALTNVAKHARASHVELTVGCDEGLAWASVEDDGIGFDPAAAHADGNIHWGLVMMRERAESVGAHLRVDATPGRGTRIQVEVERAP